MKGGGGGGGERPAHDRGDGSAVTVLLLLAAWMAR